MNTDRKDMDQLNDFLQRESFEDCMSLVGQHLIFLQSAYGEHWKSNDILLAKELIDKSRSALADLEKSYSELSHIYNRISVSNEMKDAKLMETFYVWLENIQRMKNDVATHK